jgi:adenine-specific DNA-methyltransferase
MNKLKQTLEEVLKTESSFLGSESGELNYIKVKDSADRIDEKLIALLADNQDLKAKFFSKIKDVYVFNINDFKFFLDENKINNSYTKYANKIGLSAGGDLLRCRSEVVLDFPFKDCFLEGGQSTEEGMDNYYEYEEEKIKKNKQKKVIEPVGYKKKQSKRKETFFNQILAHDEIDRLFDKKALVNWKRFAKDSGNEGESVKEIKRDENGLIKENLIIKGNNLLALHSIKSEFAGKIKLIYIDPPYYFEKDKKEDAFAYNSNFKLSTWLTFMKNRFDVAKELMSDDGVIYVQINDDGHGYLKLLLNDVFEGDNFINHISVKVKSSAGFKTVNKGLMETSEYIYLYSKNKQKSNIKNIFIETSYDENYKLIVKNPQDDMSKWVFSSIDEEIKTDEKFKNLLNLLKDRELKEFEKDIFLNLKSKYALNNSDKVFRYTAINTDAGKETLEAKEKSIKDKKVYSVQTSKGKRYIHNGQQITFYSSKLRNIDNAKVPTEQLTNIWNDIRWEGIAKEGGVVLKKGKKPERLLKRILDMSTSENDIVLDYHLGSGTTCAVAHKMNRRYIGIEQLDYEENDSVDRLKNVIKGDNSGISKILNWKGGGDFIYCELAKWNEKAKEEIQGTKDLPALVKLFNTLYERYFLNYNVKIKDFKEEIIKEENFKKLSLDEQKRMFLTMLDLNQMYVNESEMVDKKYGISTEDQKLTKEFYKNK